MRLGCCAAQVVEACRHVTRQQAGVASGQLPASQQIAPITNIVFMVRPSVHIGQHLPAHPPFSHAPL